MKKKKYHIAGGPSRYLFLLPGGLVYFLIILLPAFYSLYLSFFKWNGADRNKEFVGIDNYVNLIVNDPVFKRALVNNTIWIVLTVCAVVPVALLFAVLINQKFKGRTVVRGILYFPSILSGITVAITWNWVYHPQLGLYNNFVKLIGQPELAKAWLADSQDGIFRYIFGRILAYHRPSYDSVLGPGCRPYHRTFWRLPASTGPAVCNAFLG